MSNADPDERVHVKVVGETDLNVKRNSTRIRRMRRISTDS